MISQSPQQQCSQRLGPIEYRREHSKQRTVRFRWWDRLKQAQRGDKDDRRRETKCKHSRQLKGQRRQHRGEAEPKSHPGDCERKQNSRTSMAVQEGDDKERTNE